MRSGSCIAMFATAIAGIAVSCSSFSGSDDEVNQVDASLDSTPDGSSAAPATATCAADLSEGWGQPERMTMLRGEHAELTFIDPFVTADGLHLLLVNATGSPYRVFHSTRAHADAEWSVARELVGVTVPTYDDPYPSTALPEDEVIVVSDAVRTDIHEMTFLDGGWTAAPITALVRPDYDFAATISADGLLLVYEEANASSGNPFRILLQSTRAAPTAESPWSGSHQLRSPPFDGGSTDIPWSHPALTPDGLGLFYSIDSSKGVVYLARRKTRQEELFPDDAPPTVVSTLSASGFASYVRSVTADGCEAYLTSDRDGVLDTYRARRRP